MRSKIIKYALGLALLVIVSVWFYIQDNSSYNINLAQEETEADLDDPNGRRSLEWMKLRDPKIGDIPIGARNDEIAFTSRLPVSGGPNGINLFNNQEWQKRGPWNIGGRTRALAFDVKNSSVILAAGVNGGIWRTENKGLSWTKTTGSLEPYAITSMVQDQRPGRENEWYATTREFAGLKHTGKGQLPKYPVLYKSIDGGKSWASMPVANGKIDQTTNCAINIGNTSDTELFISTSSFGIYKIYNNGQSIKQVLPTAGRSIFFTNSDVVISSSGLIYAYIADGVYRSTDGGEIWTRISRGISNFESISFGARVILALAPSNENILYVLGETPGQGSKFRNSHHSFLKYEYLSGDGSGTGGRWEDRSQNLDSLEVLIGNEKGFHTQAGYDIALKVLPTNPDVVFFGGTDLHRTTDGLATKNNVIRIGGYHDESFFYPNHHPDQHILAFDPNNPSVLISGHDGGVSITNDCLVPTVSWEFLNNGYLTTQFYNISISPNKADYTIIGGMQDNETYISTNSNLKEPWLNLTGGDGGFCYLRSDGSMITSAQDGHFYLLPKSFPSDRKSTFITPAGATDYLFINPFAIDPFDEKVMYLPVSNEIWRNSNIDEIPSGNEPTTKNWTKSENTQSIVGDAKISAISISSIKRNRVFFATSNGKVFLLDDAHLVSSIPKNITSSNFPNNGFITSIALDPDNENTAIVVFSNYGISSIFYTENSGESWADISGNLEENSDGSGAGPSCQWANIFKTKNNEKVYFIGTTSGLYSTTNLQNPQPTQAPVWVRDLKVDNIPVTTVTSRISDGFIAIGTYGGGVLTNTIDSSTSSIADKFSNQLEKPQLLQNYPNPFIQETTIPFILEKTQKVSLVIYDMNGRRVKSLLDEIRNKGRHTVDFKPFALSSGTYFYTLQTELDKITKKMVTIH